MWGRYLTAVTVEVPWFGNRAAYQKFKTKVLCDDNWLMSFTRFQLWYSAASLRATLKIIQVKKDPENENALSHQQLSDA